jgi:putative transposase
VEANAKRAGLVRRAVAWSHGSAALHGTEAGKEMLAPWPLPRPADWEKMLDEPLAGTELKRVQTSVNRGRPYGSENWVKRAVKRLGLEHTLRERGRPKKKMEK